MHVKTYPAFFTPRDEEPSLSSSEECKKWVMDMVKSEFGLTNIEGC